ncbi:VOC family protein [Prescottella equi]
MRGGFVTRDQGLGHIVFQVPDIEKANEFYVYILGFRLSDRITTKYFNVRFYHINGRHHSLALSEFPGHVGFNHLMLEVEHMDDLGRLIDLLDQHDVEIMQSLGRQIEYGYGGLTVDDLSWVARTYTRPSNWGHKLSETAKTQIPGIVKELAPAAV